ncbi:hypothetical protein BESB_064670 [Besnoitia besnoiti]|uniref:KIF-binding protein n=1 Tax=Besnoitia besnoiti TaxID=94643 RepID=A0A2A9MES0_BESBE|nr:hypothetical protein BESB_064670 [Besnoitia besnoiti]PFH34436.1 hypothetical protein BESB_064670 [Besnoitia besnoiti]
MEDTGPAQAGANALRLLSSETSSAAASAPRARGSTSSEPGCPPVEVAREDSTLACGSPSASASPPGASRPSPEASAPEDEEAGKKVEALRLLRELFSPSQTSSLDALLSEASFTSSCSRTSSVPSPASLPAAETGGHGASTSLAARLGAYMVSALARYREILRREQDGCPVDPDEEEEVQAALGTLLKATGAEPNRPETDRPELLAPFRPKYAGRRLLQKTAQDLYKVYRRERQREEEQRSQSGAQTPSGFPASDCALLCLAHLYGMLGQNYINTEETQEGERRLRKCVEVLMKVPPPPFAAALSPLDWSLLLLFSPSALRLRVAVALLDLAGLYCRWQRTRDARACFWRGAALLSLAETELDARLQALGGAEAEARSCAREGAHDDARATVRLLLVTTTSLRFLQRCVSAQLRLLPLEEDPKGVPEPQTCLRATAPLEAARETCVALSELLEKRSGLLERARRREARERQEAPSPTGAAAGAGAAPGDAPSALRPAAASADALVGTAGGVRPPSASDPSASRRSGAATATPNLVLAFFAFSPFVVDTKEIVRNLLSLASFFGFSSAAAGASVAGTQAPPSAESGLLNLFSAEYVLLTAEVLLEDERARAAELRGLREERRRRRKANAAREAQKRESGNWSADAGLPQNPAATEEGGDCESDDDACDSEEADREGGEIVARICRPDSRTLDELLAEVHRDKGLLYAHRLRASRDVLSDPAGCLAPLVRRHEGTATETPGCSAANRAEDAEMASEVHSARDDSHRFVDLINKQVRGKTGHMEEVRVEPQHRRVRTRSRSAPSLLASVCFAVFLALPLCSSASSEKPRVSQDEQPSRVGRFHPCLNNSAPYLATSAALHAYAASRPSRARGPPGPRRSPGPPLAPGAWLVAASALHPSLSHASRAFGGQSMILAMGCISILGSLVWAHHMVTVGLEDCHFPPALLNVQDCLALLSLPEALLAARLAETDAPTLSAAGDESRAGTRAAPPHSAVTGPEAPRPASSFAEVSAATASSAPSDFSLRALEASRLLPGGESQAKTTQEGGATESPSKEEVTLWRPNAEERGDARLVRLTDVLYVRCGVHFPTMHQQVAKKMQAMNREFLTAMGDLQHLHSSLLPYKDFIARHLMALALCDDFAAPRSLFTMARHEAQEALKTFVLDGWASEHTRLIIHEAALYKELIFFEDDLQRSSAMLSRRAKLLSSLVTELNPQHYLDLVRQMQFELGDVYKDLYELKWTGRMNKGDSLDDLVELDPDMVQKEEIERMKKSIKLHAYAERSIACFTSFIDSFRKTAPRSARSKAQEAEPEPDIPSEVLPVYLGARISRAKMLTRAGRNKDEMIQAMAQALKEYEWLKQFLSKQRPEGRSNPFLLHQLELCEQTLQLLPLRISKLAALGR